MCHASSGSLLTSKLPLGIVHIEESGAAEPYFDEDYGKGRRSRRYDDMDEEIEEEDDDESAASDFEVVEVVDGSCYVDQWVDTEEREMDFGPLPIEEGEVLPAGALDDEKPDEQRLTEATGNEGASFERSYHRAALVLWPKKRFADVLLQSGVGAVMPYLKEKMESATLVSAAPAARDEARALALRVLDVWESASEYQLYGRTGQEPSRAEMLDTLGRLGDAELLERFLSGIVIRKYDGTENAVLAAHARLLK